MTLKELSILDWETRCKTTSMRPDYVPKEVFSDKTANKLTKAVITFLRLKGCQAERVANSGRYIDESKIVTDVLGNKRKIGTGKYIKGSGVNGTADIASTIPVTINNVKVGIKVAWEVKMKDKQSEAQKIYQTSVEQAGGFYFIIHNFL